METQSRWGPQVWEKTQRMIEQAIKEGRHSNKPHTETCVSCGKEAQPYEGVIGTRRSICKECWKKRQVAAADILKIIRRKP